MPDGVTLFLAAGLAVAAWLFRQRFRAVEDRLVRSVTSEDLGAANEELKQSLEHHLADQERLGREDRTRAREEKELLDSRVRALEATLEETMQSARDDVESLREGLAEMKSALRALTEQVQGLQRRLESAAVPAAAGVGHVVRHALEEQGFERIRFLDEQAALQAPDGQVVAVEARRAGAAYKGTVRLAEGGVETVDLRPGYQVFP